MESVLRFGEFELDPRLRELRCGSKTVRLQDQPFHVLSMMLERPGDVVTREDIQARLWPDGTAVDFEHSVNAAIKRLRTALGDDAARPRYVETLPRLGYRFIARLHRGEQAAAPPALVKAERPRLVVLPFVNLTGEAARDYFSDGLTEELIAQLGRRCADRVGVVARTSAMLYKNVNKGAADIGGALRADYLVEGSVRVNAGHVRITAQLIETKGETHLWAESYDRDLADGLAVQAEVAAEIASTLTRDVLPATPDGAITHVPRAFDAYLTGRYHWNKVGDVGLFDAVACYDTALDLDPRFARAHSARARAYVALAEYYRMDPIEALQTARVSAERAIALDPADADAHVVLGEVRRVVDWDWQGAQAMFQRALVLNPSNAAAHRYHLWFLGTRDRVNDALGVCDRAYQLDPLCFAMTTFLASISFFAGDHASVLARTKQVLIMEPGYLMALRLAAASLVALDRTDEAIAQFEAVPESSLPSAELAWKGHALAAGGSLDRARQVLGRIEGLRRTQFVSDYHVALLHAGLGDRDGAIRALGRACDHRDPWLDAMAVDPRFTALRGDARFEALRSRLRLQQRPAELPST